MRIEGKNALIVGLGLSGLAVAPYLLRQGARVAATDHRTREQLGETARRLEEQGVVLHLGGHPGRAFEGVDLIVISPGVPVDLEPVARARRSGTMVIGELGLAALMLETPMVAITGSNGKSTVVSLVAAILSHQGLDVCLAGNIGRPLIGCLDSEPQPDTAVVEVSSFQLETVSVFRPRVAAVLNISPDHLDRHADMSSYFRIKTRIWADLGVEDSIIVPAEDRRLVALAQESQARLHRFGLEPFRGPGVYLSGNRAVITDFGGGRAEVDISGRRLAGRHNTSNILAALLAARLMGADSVASEKAVNAFSGLPHRLQWVAAVNGVDFFNDSKATNVAAAVSSITGFDRAVILIAGGLPKGGDFQPLAGAAAGRLAGAVLIGQAADRLAGVLEGACPILRASDMFEAVREAAGLARPGDVVLLAPACASFDQYQNYATRGEAFVEAVEELA